MKELIERGELGGDNSEVKQLQEQVRELKNKIMLSEEDNQQATMEQVDAKIMGVLEKLKLQNQTIWADTVKKAEAIFNTKGIQETMDLMPNSL